MLKKIKQSIIVAAVMLLSAVTLLGVVPQSASALDPQVKAKEGFTAAGGGNQSLNASLQTIVSILMFVIGAVAVIVIVIGGLRYVTSDGNAEQIKSAKNTILYAIIGIIVALLAYAIVNFILSQFAKP